MDEFEEYRYRAYSVGNHEWDLSAPGSQRQQFESQQQGECGKKGRSNIAELTKFESNSIDEMSVDQVARRMTLTDLQEDSTNYDDKSGTNGMDENGITCANGNGFNSNASPQGEVTDDSEDSVNSGGPAIGLDGQPVHHHHNHHHRHSSKHTRSYSAKNLRRKVHDQDNVQPQQQQQSPPSWKMRPRTLSMPTKNAFSRQRKIDQFNSPDEIVVNVVEEDCDRVRSFSTSAKGEIINRGDSFKRKKPQLVSYGGRSVDNDSTAEGRCSESTTDLTLMANASLTNSNNAVHNSRAPSVVSQGSGGGVGAGGSYGRLSAGSSRHDSTASDSPTTESVYTVLMTGTAGVGKSSLMQQFMTSEYMGNVDVPEGKDESLSLRVLLDDVESLLNLAEVHVEAEDMTSLYGQADAYVIVYAATERGSFDNAVDILYELRKEGLTQKTAIILVANKCDIVRNRAVTEEDGKTMAVRYGCKYIEVSTMLDLNVDTLLVGILKQIRLNGQRQHNNSNIKGRKKASVDCFSDVTTDGGGGSHVMSCLSNTASVLVSKILKTNRQRLYRSCDNLLI